MKKTFFFMALSISIASIFFSCQKEISCEGCKENNKPPIAIAGLDQIITLPTDSILLDGRSSSDPDGTISSWLWKKISGPASFNIIRSNDSITRVKALSAGTYQFELKVTDNKGLSATDTMQVIVDAVVTTNHPPVANAGPDQTITLPVNSVNLDGSASTDPDNNITTYAWKKISGPSSFNITNTSAVQTQVTNVIEGAYQYELKVTDAGGLFSKDTVYVAVNAQPAQPAPCDHSNWPVVQVSVASIGILSEPRAPEGGANGTKVVFAGGEKEPVIYPHACDEVDEGSSVVDIYNTSSHTWSTAQLSKARLGMSIENVQNKILFAGGYSWTNYPWGQWNAAYSNVDIYDASQNSWQLAQLSKGRYDMAVAKIGNKILFAGGIFPLEPPFTNDVYYQSSNSVDIYDFSNNSWSVTTLSSTPGFHALYGVTIGSKAFFIHRGINQRSSDPWSVVDIYDNNTNSWSASNFQTMVNSLAPPSGMGLVDNLDVVGNNIIFWSGQNQAGIRNLSSGITSIACVSRKPAYLVNNKIIFFNGANQFEIFDTVTGIWSVGLIDTAIPTGVQYSIVQLGQTIYLGGGFIINTYCDYSSNVYKLEF